MSFSADLKKELSLVCDKPRHCRIAELGAIFSFLGKTSEGGAGIRIASESMLPVSVCAELIRKIFGFSFPVSENARAAKGGAFSIFVENNADNAIIFRALKLDADPSMLITRRCCRCAFLRGAFLSSGTVSDPDRAYSFEIVCRTQDQADIIREILSSLGAAPGVTTRRRNLVVYVKEGDMISDLLGYMGARTGLLELENRRIIRGTRGRINRRVNCETANINKTATAAAAQIAAIEKIERVSGLSSLPDGLDEIARLRLEYPAATLLELGQMLEMPIGKSGVNHRLRKILEISKTI